MRRGPKITREGLVLHLDALNPNSYSGSGSTWYDLSGYGNNATLYNSPTYNPDGYFIFDGSSHYGRISSFDLSYTQSCTIFMLFKVLLYSGGTEGKDSFIILESSVNYNSYDDTYILGGNTGDNYGNNISVSTHGVNGYNLGVWDKSLIDHLKWNMYTPIIDKSETVNETFLYQNGEEKTRLDYDYSGNNHLNNNPNNLSNRSLYIASRAGTGFFTKMNLNLLMIYNRRLNDFEIKQITNSFRSRFNV